MEPNSTIGAEWYERTIVEEEKWKRWKTNKRLLSNLKKRYGTEEFNLKDAYKIYKRLHARTRDERYEEVQRNQPQPTRRYNKKEIRAEPYGDYWNQMNVRNTISKAAYEGALKRIRAGCYKFNK